MLSIPGLYEEVTAMSLFGSDYDINPKENLPYYLFLSFTQVIGIGTYRRIEESYTSLGEFFESGEKSWKDKKIFTDIQLKYVTQAKEVFNAQAMLERMAFENIHYVPINSVNFPKKLENIQNPPMGLFYIGNLPRDERLCVAVIGARECSYYGEDIAKLLGRKLAECNIDLVSGMARGIDSTAQLESVNAGGRSFAVLGNSVDYCYPRESTALYRKLCECGGIISEYPPGTKPLKRYFAMRNRIISGLSDAVVVVEAKERSGTLITVDDALNQGKDIYAVPGRINDRTSKGCNGLIKQGAGIITDVDSFVYNLAARMYDEYMPAEKSDAADRSVLSSEEISFLEKIGSDSFTPDEVLKRCHLMYEDSESMTAKEAQNMCLNLCDKGILVSLGGNRFKRFV